MDHKHDIFTSKTEPTRCLMGDIYSVSEAKSIRVPIYCPALAVKSNSIMMTGHSSRPFSARRLEGLFEVWEVIAAVLQNASRHCWANSGESFHKNSS